MRTVMHNHASDKFVTVKEIASSLNRPRKDSILWIKKENELDTAKLSRLDRYSGKRNKKSGEGGYNEGILYASDKHC